MAKLYNLARMTTATTGTGTITLGAAVSGYLTFAQAGVADGDIVDYAISDGANSEHGTGTYTATGTTLTRNVTKSTNSNAAISLSGTAQVFISPRAETLNIEQNRWNSNLTAIYQSKVYGTSGLGGYRRLINIFADGFTTQTGINTGSSSNYAFDNISGLVAPSLAYGANLGSTTAAISSTPLAGTTTAAIGDGVTNATGWASNESSAGVNGVSYVGYNFGAGVTKHIRQVVLYQGATGDATYSISSALVQYSDNGTSWTTQSTITIAQTLSAQTFALNSSGPHQYWRLLANSNPGAANRWGVMELQMMEATGSSNNMTYVTVSQTADASVSNGRVLLEIDNTATPTLNTDLTVEVTCNGGTNWSSATLSSISANGQSGRSVLESVDQTCTAGTSFAARIKTFNNKNIPIYGLCLTVH